MTEHNELAYINHILDAIDDIEESIDILSKEKFIKTKDIKEANIRRLEIIGEAVSNLPNSFRIKYPEVPWRVIVGNRDKMIHHYFGVNLDVVWNTIKKDVPDLKQKILRIKRDLEKDQDGKRRADNK
ncbi:hypothetical protein CMI42_00455 [Candidatus Pacearchaeota archaeon]|nr:hypothetical protein [Candidatus Pacearchaeota archaeon]